MNFSKTSRRCALGITMMLVAATFTAVGTGPAGALQPPWTQSTISVHQEPHVICRAYGGSIAANTEADQDLGFTVTYPDGVHNGDTFNIKIRPDVSLYPRDDRSSGVTATIRNIYNQMSGYQLPAGVTINSVTVGPANGDVEANADAGYYVNRDNVPHSVVSGVGDIPTPGFDPMTLSAAQRLAIPGTAPNAFWNTSTNRLYTTLLGSTVSPFEFAGGSALQGPTVTVNVTATALEGSHLQVKLAGQLPGSEPRNYTGSQPGNFGAPSSGAALTSTAAVAPWSSTNGTRWVYGGDSVWTDPTYLNTVHTTALGGLITVQAKAACAPGYEVTSAFPTPPSYYTGPGAIPNGTSPALTDTVVVQDVDTNPSAITITSPIDGANYVSEQPAVIADYDCNDLFGSGDDICDGDVADGAPIDMSPGPHSFTVDAQDLAGNPSTTTINYSVAPNQDPVANHGPNQTGKKTGNTVTLDGSASTDPDGPPAQALTYTWTQTGGVPVTLSDVNAQKPTFVVPAAPDFVYPHSIDFALTVDDPYGGTDTTVDSVSVQVTATTPTVTAVTRTPTATPNTGNVLTLGSTVSNPDGGALTYAWSQASGRTTSLSSASAVNPTFVVPSSGAAPTTTACTSGTGATSGTSANCPRFQLAVTATETGGGTSPTVALAAYSSTLPTRPVANAGAAQSIASAGGTVTLDGSASTQAQGHTVSYAWSQTSGPAVTLSATNVAQPTFTAPPSGGSPVTYGFSLTVVDTQSPITGSGTNGNTSLAATTSATVVPDHVVANAGPDQPGKVAGNVVTLNATGSTDPTLAPLTYTWTQTSGPAVTLSDAGVANPTFTVPAVTAPAGHTFSFEVTATNGGVNPSDTDTDTVDVSSVASTPVAAVPVKTRSGGTCTNFCTGDLITLSTAITNPDGTSPGDYTYVWSQVSGRTTSLSSTTAANPTYTLPSSGSSPTSAACTSGTGATSGTSANCPRFQVIVTKTNTAKASAAAVMAAHASTLPTRPVANAGPAQNVKVGSGTVTLDGSASTQAQAHTLSYAWTQTAGPAVTLSDATAIQPTFTAPITPASYTFSLVVTDTQSPITSGGSIRTSLASTVNVTVSNYASPIADPGPNQAVLVGSGTVTLDASGSSQADGHTLSYLWAQTAGTPVTLSDATAIMPTFTAPVAGTTLKFTVTVTDTQNPNPAAASTTSPEVTVGVGDFVSPQASQGPDQTVHRRDVVTLDASGSSQADGHNLTYLWSQTEGTPVTLSDATAAMPTFTAPEAAGSLKFTVTVTDTQNPNPLAASTTSGPVQIDVQDYAAPVADAGANQSNIEIGTTVTLDGSGSAQVDGHGLTYSWTQVAGPPVTLSSSTAQKPTFTAPTGPATLEFELTVDDTFNPSAPASTFVNVNGIAGLDFSAQISGDIRGEKATSPLVVTVVNNGVLTRSITSSGLAVSITRNDVAVPASEYAIASKTVSLAAHKQTKFTLTWTHGTTALHLGDDIEVSVCVNQLGDSVPANNCGVKTDPAGPMSVFAWPKNTTVIKSTQTTNNLAVWITNMSSFAVRPIRVAENMTVTVSVNGGPAQAVAPPTMAPFSLGPNLGTDDAIFVWGHPKLAKGSTVEVTACAVNVPGNTAVPNCWSRTITVT